MEPVECRGKETACKLACLPLLTLCLVVFFVCAALPESKREIPSAVMPAIIFFRCCLSASCGPSRTSLMSLQNIRVYGIGSCLGLPLCTSTVGKMAVAGT